MPKNSDTALLFQNKGSAVLVFVMLTAALVLGLSAIFLMKTSHQKKMSIRSITDAEVSAAESKIGAIFSSPADCNANFYVLTPAYKEATGTLTAIKVCGYGHNCRPSIAPDNTTTKITVTTESWDPAVTGITSRVRIRRAEYAVAHLQNGSPNDPSIMSLSYDIEKRLGYGGAELNSIVTKTIEFPALLDPSHTKILGCTKSANSTVVYGE